MVITKKNKAGEIDGQAIWEVAGTEVLGYKRTTLHLNEQQVSISTDVFFLIVISVLAILTHTH